MATIENRRVVVARRGGPEVLEVVVEDVPEPGPDEIRVKTVAAGVSGYDVMLRRHWFPGQKLPYTPGEDVVGLVDKLGAGVTGLEVGQRVALWTFGDAGGYAEYVVQPAVRAVPVPTDLDAVDAVALIVNYLTASLAMNQMAGVQPGERMLVHGAAGGVGSALVQLGTQAGLGVYGTASEYNHDLVESLGAVPIDYRNHDFVAKIRDLTADGVDVVFDVIGGGRQLWRSSRVLRKGGRLIMLGNGQRHETRHQDDSWQHAGGCSDQGAAQRQDGADGTWHGQLPRGEHGLVSGLARRVLRPGGDRKDETSGCETLPAARSRTCS